MEERFRRPRGTADILPPDSERFEQLRRLVRETAGLYGYREIQTPVFEQTAVFVEGVGEATDVVQHERYTFVDAGGTSLTLRPEGTAAVARAYVEHGMGAWPQPVRLFYWQPMFRRERPQQGRYRQHLQYGVELFGSAAPQADAEVVAVAVRILQRAGQQPVVHLNSMGCDDCRPAYREALVGYYRGHRAELCDDCQIRLEQNPLRLLDCKRDVALKDGAPDIADFWCPACAEHQRQLMALLKDLGVGAERDRLLVRGLDYYYRTVFEVHDPRLGAQSTLRGGGRYDGLTSRFGGPPTPAVGFAGGAERLVLVAGAALDRPERPRVYVAQVGGGHEAFSVAEDLRRRGVAAESDVLGRSLKAQMKEAGRRARWAVLVGGSEWVAGQVPVRDLATGATDVVNRADLPEVLARRATAAATQEKGAERV
jgi:histidyl-tRNA synthetase